jgi:hypothetical protein
MSEQYLYAGMCAMCTKMPTEYVRYYSNTSKLWYWYPVNSALMTYWCPNNNNNKTDTDNNQPDGEWMTLCGPCIRRIIDRSWIMVDSKTRPGSKYHYNMVTQESTAFTPSTVTTIVTTTTNTDPNQPPSLDTAPQLISKRDYLFRGLSKAYPKYATLLSSIVPKIQMDEVASFSVTEASVAKDMTDLIYNHVVSSMNNGTGQGQGNDNQHNNDITICDGMACVGGNTLSFMLSGKFAKVWTNEYDYYRYQRLVYNVSLLGRSNEMKMTPVHISNQSVTDLTEPATVLFLDPEWGGVNYKDSSALRLTIADQSVEQFVLSTLQSKRIQVVALKLPTNYDLPHLKEQMVQGGYSMQTYTQLKKMVLVLVSHP